MESRLIRPIKILVVYFNTCSLICYGWILKDIFSFLFTIIQVIVNKVYYLKQSTLCAEQWRWQIKKFLLTKITSTVQQRFLFLININII